MNGSKDLETRRADENRTVDALAKALKHFGALELEGGALCQAWMPRAGREGSSVLQTKVLSTAREIGSSCPASLRKQIPVLTSILNCRACRSPSSVSLQVYQTQRKWFLCLEMDSTLASTDRQ